MTKVFSVNERVQDKSGFTGTVTDVDETTAEVTWDISGCTSDVLMSCLFKMKEGQDDPIKQSDIHKLAFGKGD